MHEPVLLQAVLEGLDLKPGLTVVDATVNGGGHSVEIAKQITGGHLIGIDQDARAIEATGDRLAMARCQITLQVGNFRALDQILGAMGIIKINRLLFDLGWSSNQLSSSGRGFSFQTDEPLLMTYASEIKLNDLTAREIVNDWDKNDLVTIFKEYGEEMFAAKIAQGIIEARRATPIETTSQLVAIIRQAVPRWYRAANRRRHFATKVFQALRIAVNDEFGALTLGLAQGWDRLAPGGRIAVISFHSGEARIVKRFFREKKADDRATIITKHAIKPNFNEIKSNPRARSATLRVIQKNI